MNDFRREAVALYREMAVSVEDEKNLGLIQKALQSAAEVERIRWIVALAEGMKRAGCLRSPLEPDPALIEKLIRGWR